MLVLKGNIPKSKNRQFIYIKGRDLPQKGYKNLMKRLKLNLHLFEDAGSVDSGANADGLQNGAEIDDNSQVAQGNETEEASKPSFDDLINGEYKEDYKKNMYKVVRSRLKGAKETEKRLNSFTPLLEVLANRYGIESDDVSQLDAQTFIDRIMDDDSIYESESLEKNIPIDALKRMKKMEMENQAMRKQLEAEQIEMQQRADYEAKLQEAEELKEYYPNFDFNELVKAAGEGDETSQEMIKLLHNNVPMKIAFEVTHPEVITNAMKVVAQTASEKVANSVKANSKRPREGGAGITGTPAKLNPATMTSQQIRELRERALGGEHIVL